jgi:uncharacterized protein YidB (DUF937 family)
MMDLVQQFRGAGKTDAVESWVTRGPNKALSSDECNALGCCAKHFWRARPDS